MQPPDDFNPNAFRGCIIAFLPSILFWILIIWGVWKLWHL